MINAVNSAVSQLKLPHRNSSHFTPSLTHYFRPYGTLSLTHIHHFAFKVTARNNGQKKAHFSGPLLTSAEEADDTLQQRFQAS
jgi:hypothetical protein